ncbi:DNA polymerase IV [Galbitalea sp. SE-J8]|uniref:DNA polymerase IV n=1 Tax=Galbitalea sp. SE-J8 TaxID=3054952 RepID=UPI00259CB2E2|nr:DNA polymerase IV [Galbitalea sp. SE-J8]MDM4763155.1 DNA polymerase IV [Galbitalea sp. SE-J8]
MSKQDGSGRQTTAPGVDDSTATILHADLDAFFASVELLEHPELVGKPVIVTHDSARAVVTAATYEARKYGVNSAMPTARAKQLCPQAIILEPHFERYQHFSRVVMGVFDDVTPRVEKVGIDEAFLDVSGATRVFGGPIAIGQHIRRRVRDETGLVVSIGAAATKFVAKLASGRSKPDGLLVIPADGTLDFLHPLPMSALWGVGGKTEEQLARLGIRTIADVARMPLPALERSIGTASARRLHELSWGRDPRAVEGLVGEKSIGHEETFSTDIADPATLRRELLRLSSMVARRLRAQGVTGRTVVLKLRYGDFTTITRSRTLAEPTSVARRIYEEVADVYAAVGPHRPVRLIGVRMEQLTDAAPAAALWDDDEDWREAESVMDAVHERFGRGVIAPASLLGGARAGRGARAERDAGARAERDAGRGAGARAERDVEARKYTARDGRA